MPERPGKSDFPNTQNLPPRSRVVEVIERSQEDALRQLRAAGVPETQALLVIKRFSAFSVQVLRELDLLYREFEELLAQDPNRSQANQEWLDTKAGGLLLTLEAFIAALVAEALNKAKEDYRSELSQPREVITLPAKPPPPAVWEEALQELGRLRRNPVVRWPVGLFAWFLVWWLVSGSNTWALIAVGITAFVVFFFKKPGLIFILIAGGVCLLLLL
jgi:hypothetical protein